MSTKETIKYREEGVEGCGFHLYSEIFDEENVYLRLDCVHASLNTLHEAGAEVTLTLPLELARALGLIS